MSYTSDQVKALEYVLANHRTGLEGIAAVNMSMGSGLHTAACDTVDPANPRATIKPAVDALAAAGIATVIASGNDNAKTGVSSPGCISTAITVGATTKADAIWMDPPTPPGVFRFGSNSSPLVDLLAPGHGITTSTTGGGFSSGERGTSLAAPHVAGAWALYRQVHETSSVADTLAALQKAGRPVTDPANKVTVPRIDLTDPLKKPAATTTTTTSSPSTTTTSRPR
jgi:hypothetical protein